MHLSEIKSTAAVDVRKDTAYEYIARTVVSNGDTSDNITVTIEQEEDGQPWTIVFEGGKGLDRTNKMLGARVLSFVADCIKHVIQTRRPHQFEFDAIKGENRESIYNRAADTMTKYGYKKTVTTDAEFTHYRLTYKYDGSYHL